MRLSRRHRHHLSFSDRQRNTEGATHSTIPCAHKLFLARRIMRGRVRPAQNNNAGGSFLDNPWVQTAGGLAATSLLFPGVGQNIGSIIDLLPVIVLGGAVIAVVSVLKKP